MGRAVGRLASSGVGVWRLNWYTLGVVQGGVSESWWDKRRAAPEVCASQSNRSSHGRAPGGPRMRPAPPLPRTPPGQVKTEQHHGITAEMPQPLVSSPHKFVHHDPRQPSGSEGATHDVAAGKRGHRGGGRAGRPELGARQGQGQARAQGRLGVSSRRLVPLTHAHPLCGLDPVVCGRKVELSRSSARGPTVPDAVHEADKASC